LLFLSWRVGRRGKRGVLTLFLLSLSFGFAACGGGGAGGGGSTTAAPPNSNQTTAGTYAVTVIATDGAVQRTVMLNMTVTTP
jgi:hypothetical protein